MPPKKQKIKKFFFKHWGFFYLKNLRGFFIPYYSGTAFSLGGFSLDGGHRPSPSPTSRHNEEMENPCLLSLYSAYCFEILTRESPGKNLSVDSLTM